MKQEEDENNEDSYASGPNFFSKYVRCPISGSRIVKTKKINKRNKSVHGDYGNSTG